MADADLGQETMPSCPKCSEPTEHLYYSKRMKHTVAIGAYWCRKCDQSFRLINGTLTDPLYTINDNNIAVESVNLTTST